MSTKVDEIKANLSAILTSVKDAYKTEIEAGLDDLLEGLEAIRKELKEKQNED